MSDVVEVLDQERDDRILKMRLAGASIRTIARENQCTIPEINAVIDRLVDQIDNKYRMRTIAIELERLDHLHRAYFAKALQGDTAAGALLIRIGERRAALLALDSPVKVDVISLQREVEAAPSSIDRIEAALDAFRSRHNPDDVAAAEDAQETRSQPH